MLGWLVFVTLPSPAESLPAKEYQIKAACLLHFSQFVDWPASVFTDSNARLTIGILGDDPFGGFLDQVVAGETVKNHKLAVKRSRHLDDLTNCQLLFVSRSEEARISEILAQLQGASILTVGDMEGFARRGGMIDFLLQGVKVRIEINARAAQQAGIRIGSQLRELSIEVRTGN